jgi:hypothetical protein
VAQRFQSSDGARVKAETAGEPIERVRQTEACQRFQPVVIRKDRDDYGAVVEHEPTRAERPGDGGARSRFVELTDRARMVRLCSKLDSLTGDLGPTGNETAPCWLVSQISYHQSRNSGMAERSFESRSEALRIQQQGQIRKVAIATD